LGGSNRIPLSYVENCADAMVLAATVHGIEGEVFNIVDDDLPTSKEFLKLYKKNVKAIKSIYVPYPIFYFFCYLWEKYSIWSKNQLPRAFNRLKCSANWKGNEYSNTKIKNLLGWKQEISRDEGLKQYFMYCRNKGEYI
jgi:nucleoside-diphosphate-sugar epimerase